MKPVLKRYLLATFVIVSIGLSSLEKINAEEAITLPDTGIKIGERLVYKISWLRIPVGVGEIWAKEKTKLGDREVIHVVGTIRTNKVLSKVFPMQDEAHSWIDVETLESLQFEKKVDELFLNAHERMIFDAARKIGHFESFTTGEKKEFDITTPVHDVLSVVYWVRRQVLAPGKSVNTVLSCDLKDWALQVDAIKYENVKLNGKKIRTLRVNPTTRIEGVEKRGRARFSLTLDSSQTPVRIAYKAPFGSVVGTLLVE